MSEPKFAIQRRKITLKECQMIEGMILGQELNFMFTLVDRNNLNSLFRKINCVPTISASEFN